MGVSRPTMNSKRIFGAFVAAIFLAQNGYLLQASEANLWQDRQRALKNSRVPDEAASFQNAINNPQMLLASLPKADASLSHPFSPKALSDLGIAADLKIDKQSRAASKVVPDWIQTAVAPYATIQGAALSKKSGA